ncbi:acyltransferase [Gemmata sp. JC673]|uniref:Acyltransferase n=1 Tax=Gemmata algarum TaxID=2975278 RepID=A0ABU5ES01_9BACT|nr:acyltransferase [Gemmata algarum]MDY3557851.1 acyltransferase [Gemmata algarum]
MLRVTWARAVQAARRARFAWAGAEFGAGCDLARGVVLAPGVRNGRRGRVTVGSNVSLGRGAVLRAWGGSVAVGANVFVGEYTVVYGHGGVSIGDDTLIAMHCRILSSNHTIPPRGERIRHHPDVLLPTAIGRDVWLGAGVTVLGGVTIGDGCVVAAGAVVTRDLPAYAVAAGVPAKTFRFRE